MSRGALLLLGRCVGKPGTVLSSTESGELTTVHAVVCPAGHVGAEPVVAVDLSAAGHPGWKLSIVPEACCPACPGEWLMPSRHLPVTPGGLAGGCRCCLGVWWPGTNWWGCADTGRLISVAGPVSTCARVQPGPGSARLQARALAVFSVPAGQSQALAAGPFRVTLYEHSGHRYAVVTSDAAQVRAVFKMTRAGAEAPGLAARIYRSCCPGPPGQAIALAMTGTSPARNGPAAWGDWRLPAVEDVPVTEGDFRL